MNAEQAKQLERLEKLEKSGRIIYRFISGSHAYGLNIPTSDIDKRGIFYRTKSELLSLQQGLSDPVSDTTNDTSYYSIGRFFDLAKDCNPNICEFFFMPKEVIETCSPLMQKIIDNKHLFISKKAKHTFAGYAHEQCARAKGQNKWVNNPKPKERPERFDFCWFMPTDASRKFLKNPDVMPNRPVPLKETHIDLKNYSCSSFEHCGDMFRIYDYGDYLDMASGIFKNGEIVCSSIPKEDERNGRCHGFLIFNKSAYNKEVEDWKNYWTWVKNRNPTRWLSQERGEIDYDAKHLCHCIRLLWSCINILKNGEPIIRWTGKEREFLMDVRAGKFEYDFLMNMADEKMKEIDTLYETSTIPYASDIKKIDELYLELLNEIG